MMGSMTWRAAAVVLLGCCSVFAAEETRPGSSAKAGQPGASGITPKVGQFTISMHSMFNPIPKTLQLMDFWFPLPFEDARQKIYQRVISAPYNMETVELEDHTAAIAYMKGAPRGGLPLQSRITFHVERFEDLGVDISKATDKPATDEDKLIHERWTRPDTLVAVGKEMKSAASKIVSGRKKTIDKARAIYDHLVDKVQIVTPYELRGAGYGNAKFTLAEMKGDNRDISSAFVGLCRSLGIPARTVIGLKIPAAQKEGGIEDFHSWAEFYLNGAGWVPVDPTEAKRNPARRAYYFGQLDERRLAMSIGRDLTLVPPQAGPPLNYWIKPYWEGDQKPMTDPYVQITYSEIDEIPGKPPAPSMPTSKPEVSH